MTPRTYLKYAWSITFMVSFISAKSLPPDTGLEKLDKLVCNFCPSSDDLPANCGLPKEEVTSLVGAVVIFRHGARTPLHQYPMDPFKEFDYGVEQGQLTKEGKHWSYRLGQYLRCRYGNAGFISENYSMSQLFCRHSEYDRTAMTSYSVLAGLFPPTPGDLNSHMEFPKVLWQPIPCFTIASTLDRLIKRPYSCPKYQRLLAKQEESRLPKLEAEYHEVLEEFKKNSGSNISHLYRVYDTIKVQHCQYNLSYPTWFQKSGEELRKIASMKFYDDSDEMNTLSSGPLMNEIIQNFETILNISTATTDANGKPLRKGKMYLYGGHDTTLSSLLNSLKVYKKDEVPPYNSAVIFELYKNPSSGGLHDYVLKLFYRTDPNGLAKEIPLPFCNNEGCTFEQFKKWVTGISTNDQQWNEKCKD